MAHNSERLFEMYIRGLRGPGSSVRSPAGSVIVYNGSVWHGHTANLTDKPRRSIQGAYIRRDAEPGTNQAERIRPETLGRIGQLAKQVLAV